MGDNVENLKTDPDYLAPDGSEIYLLVEGDTGSMCECVLPPGQTSNAVAHKTIEELWYFTEGEGEVFRKGMNNDQPEAVSAGASLRIPENTAFQFRNSGDRPLRFVITSIPPWPGAEEAVSARGFW